MGDDYGIYRMILKNESIKKEFQDYIRIIVRTIVDEGHTYIYLMFFMIALNFAIVLTTLILVILK